MNMHQLLHQADELSKQTNANMQMIIIKINKNNNSCIDVTTVKVILECLVVTHDNIKCYLLNCGWCNVIFTKLRLTLESIST